jgi:hypothetical protein
VVVWLLQTGWMLAEGMLKLICFNLTSVEMVWTCTTEAS